MNSLQDDLEYGKLNARNAIGWVRYYGAQMKFEEYVQGLLEEHKDLSDEQINIPAPFIGRKRNARWEDERRRRGF